MRPPRRAAGLPTTAPTEAAVLVLLALYAVLLIDGIVTAYAPTPITVVGLIGSAVVLMIVQAVHTLRALRPIRDRAWPVTLTVQAAVCLAWVPAFALVWLGFLGFLLASCVILLRLRWTLVAFAAADVLTLVLELRHGGGVQTGVSDICSYVLVASLIWGLCTSADLTARLAATRAEAARVALARDQERFGRDLDTLVGARLLAIRAQTATALADLGGDPTNSAVDEIIRLSRAALTDVRTIANGDRSQSLTTQLELARSILATAGIDLQAELTATGLPGPADAALSQLVREVVTAAVQRGVAKACMITLTTEGGAARLIVTLDATTDVGGLGHLHERFAALGGTLSTHSDSSRGTVVQAHVPARSSDDALTAASPIPSPTEPRPDGFVRSAS